jgi:transposase-like protein
MTKRVRQNRSPVFKAKVALAALKGEKPLVELAQQFGVPVNQITQWNAQLLQGAAARPRLASSGFLRFKRISFVATILDG